MREIKFRAWDKKGKRMRSVDSIAFHNENSCFDFDSSHLPKVFNLWGFDPIEQKAIIVQREPKQVVLMQYTCLKDKNGKEIYEGDILKFVGGTCDILPCGIYAHQHHKPGQLLVVRLLKSGYTLSMPHHLEWDAPNLVGNVDNYAFWNHASSFEVIGNIYQNPELLTHPPLPKE